MIFITEGDSAGGALVQARDVQTQAIFCLKGKPQNCFGYKRDIIYKNEELYNIMAALGIENGISGLRYNKVIIATDSDVDGMHIRNLLTTYFVVFFDFIVRGGHLYVLETPLFRVRNKSQTIYCFSEQEKLLALERIKNAEITRFKGLGEISPKEFSSFIGSDMRLFNIKFDNDYEKVIDFYMGKNTQERKQFIIDNLIVDL